MKVSILITSYNYQQFVAATIESALSQTYPDVEVIVVDDGSKDGSVQVISGFGTRIKAVFKSNGGQASAFNAGWRMATGDIVFLLDSDDVLRRDAVERVVDAWRPAYSKLHFRLAVTDAELRPLGATLPRSPLPEGNLSRQVLNQGLYISPPTSGNVFSRKFLDQVMPIPEREWRYGAETYPVFLAPLYGEIGAINDTLCFYRTHGNNFTAMSRRIEPGKLVSLLQIDLNLRRTLEQFAARLGLALSPEASTSHWLHYKIRLACCKLGGAIHPFPEDRVMPLAGQLIRAAYRAPELSPAMRAIFTAWALAVACLPKPASEPLIRLAFSPSQRPPLMRALLHRG